MSGVRAMALGGAAILLLVFGGSWAVDFVAARGLHVETRVRPAVLPADGLSIAAFTVRVSNADGSARPGDTIEVLLEGPGAFDYTRGIADGHGEVTFHYTAFKSNIYQPAAPVAVLVTDTSLGRLVEIDRNELVSIKVVDAARLRKEAHGTGH